MNDLLKGLPTVEIVEDDNGYEVIYDGKKLDGVIDYKIVKPKGKPHEFNVTLAVKYVTRKINGGYEEWNL